MLICLAAITEPVGDLFEGLYHRYKGLMYHAALRFTGHPQDAEDAVHQTFLKLAEHLDKLGADPRAWIFAVLENKARDILRQRQRHPEIGLDEAIHRIIPAPAGEAEALAAAILRLEPLQRQVILLKYHRGYSLREIAEMLDISLAWAQKLDQRAKKKLAEYLQEEGADGYEAE